MATTWSIRSVDIHAIKTGIDPAPDPALEARFADCRLYERVPITLVERNGKFLLQDGRRRLSAAKRNGEQTILAAVESEGE